MRDVETQKPHRCSQEGGKCEEADSGPGYRGKGLSKPVRLPPLAAFAFPLRREH